MHKEKAKRKRKEDKGRKGGCCRFFRNRAKKKSINKIVTIFKMKKAKRHSTLTQSRHKTQSWFELTVNHKTNLRLKFKKKKKRAKRGAVRFSVFCLWACLARFLYLHQPAAFSFFFHSFEAGGWQKHQSLQAHCVACILWHTPLAGSIQYNHTFLFSPRRCMNEYRLKRELQDKCALLLCAFVVIMFWLD